MTTLMSPLRIRGVTLPNRIAMSPMCTYSSVDGLANDWHLVHLGARAIGGVGLLIAEATGVTADGRISPDDLGLWNDEQIEPLLRVTNFLHGQGSAAGVQLAHAGRKASTWALEKGNGAVPEELGGWPVWAPSAVPFADNYVMPSELNESQIDDIVAAFAQAASRAVDAGFDVLELHAAHGYLIHQFLSPLSNRRDDQYGGSFDNRARLARRAVQAVRAVVPDETPLLVRLSATDWAPTGIDSWTLDEAIELARLLHEDGADLIDTSSGGTIAAPKIPVGPGYQVEFARAVRQSANIMTGAVGMITDPAQAEHVVRSGAADLVLLGRQLLRDPFWALHAASALGHEFPWPRPYLRAAPHGTAPRSPYLAAADGLEVNAAR